MVDVVRGVNSRRDVHWAILTIEKDANGKFCEKVGTVQKTIAVTRWLVKIPNPSTVLLIVVALFSLPAAQAADWDPPKPNPKNPVNYVEWVNETLGKGIKHNAFDDYLAAYDLIKPVGKGDRVLGGEKLAGGKRLSTWLRGSRKGLDLFRRATLENEYFFRSELGESIEDPRVDHALILVKLPGLREHRIAAKGMIAEGNRASREGDQQVLVANALTILRSAQHLYRAPSTISRLVAISVAALAYKGIGDALNDSAEPAALASQLAEQLVAADPVLPSLSLQTRMERLMIWDFCQRLFEPGSRKRSWKICGPMLEAANLSFTDADVGKMRRIGYKRTLREVDKYFDGMDAWFDTPFHSTKSGDRGKQGAPPFERIKRDTKNPLLKALLPLLGTLRSLHERITATRRATHLIVQIHVHRQKNGAFPDSLDQLDLPDLAELRIDPFSGRDFVYRPSDAQFLLYSFGDNCQNDGGRHTNWKKDGDVVFWPVQKK